MSEEYRVIGESPATGAAKEILGLDNLVWQGPATTKLQTVLRYAVMARGRGDKNVSVERRAGSDAPWEAVSEGEE